jgi:glycosyltransferase involved in cell wall biosynthesis
VEIVASIIIPTFNRGEIARECIRSINRCGIKNLEVIIVNDYKDASFEMNIEDMAHARIVNNPKSGVASARNLGASISSSAKLIFVDDDMILTKEAIENAISFLDTNKNCTYNANWDYEPTLLKQILSSQFGRFLINYNFTSLKGWNHNTIEWKENSLIATPGITSQFWAINKSDFERLGGYNESFPFAGFEDYEVMMKMKKLGINNYIDTRVLIYHNESDRVSPGNWLERKKRGAKTRRVAVEMGFSELELKYNKYKALMLRFLTLVKPIITGFTKIIPSTPFFDPLYSKIIGVLIAINIFEGYHMK